MRATGKRSLPSGSLTKQPKLDVAKDDSKSGKGVGRTSGSSTSDRDLPAHQLEGRQSGVTNVSSAGTADGSVGKGSTQSTRTSLDIHGSESKPESGSSKSADLRLSAVKDDGNEVSDRAPSSRPIHSPRHDNSATIKSGDKQQKRTSPAEEPERVNKRRKGDTEVRDFEGEVRFSDKERSMDPRLDKSHAVDLDKSGTDEQGISRATDKPSDRLKDKGSERYERDHRERLERPDKSRGDEMIAEKSRDRSMERHGRERSVERVQERSSERSFDRLTDKVKDERNKDDRGKMRYSETSVEKSHADDRFHGQSLPPPPPLPPHMVPQSVTASRRDEDADRRFGTARHAQRLSPRHEEKERRRSEEISQDDAKRRREDDIRERKREEREGLSIKVHIDTYSPNDH